MLQASTYSGIYTEERMDFDLPRDTVRDHLFSSGRYNVQYLSNGVVTQPQLLLFVLQETQAPCSKS